MRLFHGSNTEIRQIDLSRCLPHKDFGAGFYTTTIYQHASERAQAKMQEQGGKAVVSVFDFDENVFADDKLAVKCFENPSAEWVRFVMKNRNKETKENHLFDIVEGPVADDRMYAQFALFEHGIISMGTVLERITYREQTHQIVFCTPAAVALLKPEPDYAEVLIQYIIGDMAKFLINDYNISMTDALAKVYNSKIYRLITDKKTGLYRNASAHIYELLKKELCNAK